MRVVHTTSWVPRPGRRAEVLSLLATARKIHERLGFGVSAWTAVAAGADRGHVVYAMDSPSLGEHAERLVRAELDPEWSDFWPTVSDHAQRPADPLTASIWRADDELGSPDLAPAPPGQPRAMLIELHRRITPEQRATLLDEAPARHELAGRHGLELRYLHAVIAGRLSGALMLTLTAPSLVAIGHALDGLDADDAYRRLRGSVARPALSARQLLAELL